MDNEPKQQPADEKPTGSATGEQSEAKAFTQADVDRIVAERVSREQRKAQEAADKARRDAEEKAALENGEFKKLADTYKAQLDGIAPKADLADKLVEQLTAQIEARIKKLPAEVSALDPGAGDIVVRLAWLDRAEELAAKLVALAQGQTGNKPAPKPQGKPQPTNQPKRVMTL